MSLHPQAFPKTSIRALALSFVEAILLLFRL